MPSRPLESSGAREQPCEFLGSYESALGDLLIAPGEDGSVARALLASLTELTFDYLDVFGAPAGGVLTQLATDERLHHVRRVEAPVIDMPNGWEAVYVARMSSKTRAELRRRIRNLDGLGTVSWTTARTPEAVAIELDDAFEVHARRWQGRPDGSTFGRATGHAFHREATRALGWPPGAVKHLSARGRSCFDHALLRADC